MCLFFFLLCEKNLHQEKKKLLMQLRGRSVKIKLWLMIGVGWGGGAMNEGLLMKLGVTVSCFVMHFSFDQYYYQCKKRKRI